MLVAQGLWYGGGLASKLTQWLLATFSYPWAIGLRAPITYWLLARSHPQFLATQASTTWLVISSKSSSPEAIESASKTEVTIFYNLIMVVPSYHACHRINTLGLAHSPGEGIMQGYKYHALGITRAILEVCLPQWDMREIFTMAREHNWKESWGMGSPHMSGNKRFKVQHVETSSRRLMNKSKQQEVLQ